MRHTRAMSRVFVMTCEEPYSPRHNPTVLGGALDAIGEQSAGVNRYLLAGAEMGGTFADEALWRVRPNALKRLFCRLQSDFDIYGYQFRGNTRRLPTEWQERLLYVERYSKPQTVGRIQGMLSMDKYLMRLEPQDYPVFQLANGEEAMFRFFLVVAKGSSISQERFQALNSVYGIDDADWWFRYVDPAVMFPFLSSYEAMIWYTYSPHGRDVDGPHLGVCTRKPWRSFLRRVFRPGASSNSFFLDLTCRTPIPTYCLDLVFLPESDSHSANI